MNELTNILQFIAIIFIAYILYLIYKYIKAIIKLNRIKSYSLNISNKDNQSSIIKLLFKLTNILEKLKIFNKSGHTYDQYIDNNSKLNKGLDYISIKLLTGILLIIIYLFTSFLYKSNISVLIIIVNFILGYILPDFYCLYLSSINKEITNRDLINTFLIINSSYASGLSTEQVLLETSNRTTGNIKKEINHVLNDLKMGMSLHQAFKKMYDRTNNETIHEISNLLSSTSKNSISPYEIFKLYEKKLIETEKFNNKNKKIKLTNKLALLLFLFFPLIFIIYVMFIRIDISMLFLHPAGLFVFLIIIIAYIYYSLLIYKIAKGGTK